jgi:hypothetical protein
MATIAGYTLHFRSAIDGCDGVSNPLTTDEWRGAIGSLTACKAFCDARPSCKGFSFGMGSNVVGHCVLKACIPSHFYSRAGRTATWKSYVRD